MNKTPFYDFCYQQEDDNDIMLQLFKSKISIGESTGIRTIDCDKDVFRQEGSCVIASDGDRLHMCLTMGEEVEVPDGGSNGIWSRAAFDDTTYDRTNGGMSFSISSPSTTWYPASGCRNYNDGSLNYVGSFGNDWSASPRSLGAKRPEIMTFREIIYREDQNTDSIWLYREGMFMNLNYPSVT